MKMLLTFDIGNTNITIGLFDMQTKENTKPIKVWRISTISSKTADEYFIMLINMFLHSKVNIADVKYAAIASVIPSLNPIFKELIEEKLTNIDFFSVDYKNSETKFRSANPQEIGADRIANAAAAYKMFGGGIIVIDFGTATTFDCIDLDGTYLGGAIAPGPSLSAQSLNLKTAQLPQVEIKKSFKAIGVSTIECIQSGLYFGYIGLIKELINRTKQEMKVNKIIATGGLAELISDQIKEIDGTFPDLTLQGIKIIWENYQQKIKG
jgi:type III pantothenate kinase